jgi:hypothetical protein
MSNKLNESYGLEYGSKGIVICNKKNRDILVAKVKELESLLKTSKALNNTEDNTCPVCMDPIINGVVVLKCTHKLCPSCYASHSRVNNKCPMCRDEFAEKPKTTDPMPDQVMVSLINGLFENTPHGEDAYFKTLATSIKMKSIEESIRTLRYVTKENCKLTCSQIIKCYSANHP